MSITEIIARLADRQAELDRLGDIGTARAQDVIDMNADLLALAEVVAHVERIDQALTAEFTGSLARRVTALEAMFETAGNA